MLCGPLCVAPARCENVHHSLLLDLREHARQRTYRIGAARLVRLVPLVCTIYLRRMVAGMALKMLVVGAGQLALHLLLPPLLLERGGPLPVQARLLHELGVRSFPVLIHIPGGFAEPAVQPLPIVPRAQHGVDVAAALLNSLLKARAREAKVDGVSDVGRRVWSDEVRSHVVGQEDIACSAEAVGHGPREEAIRDFAIREGSVAFGAKTLENAAIAPKVTRERCGAARVHHELTRHCVRHVAQQDAHEHVKVVDGAVVIRHPRIEIARAAINVPRLAHTIKVPWRDFRRRPQRATFGAHVARKAKRNLPRSCPLHVPLAVAAEQLRQHERHSRGPDESGNRWVRRTDLAFERVGALVAAPEQPVDLTACRIDYIARHHALELGETVTPKLRAPRRSELGQRLRVHHLTNGLAGGSLLAQVSKVVLHLWAAAKHQPSLRVAARHEENPTVRLDTKAHLVRVPRR
mmetsp:Transcript_8564/g.20529  ORF Transcript_8564/g.20529 Transcript_8564/m.20529 type:complete len:463 (+) Transcript_8564:238-1626(+)